MEYDFWVCDLWNDWALDLLQDPVYVREMHWHALRLFRHNGEKFERFINELWTGDAWWNVQSKLPAGALPFCIILYADKTKLSSIGTQKGYPVYTQCPNLPAELRNGVGLAGGRMVKEDADKSRKKMFVDFRCVVWHTAFGVLLKLLKEYAPTGVSILCGDDVVRLLILIILILSVDHEEQCVMAAVRGFCSGFPCPVCLVPQDWQYMMTKRYSLRTVEEMHAEFLAASAGNHQSREDNLKAIGLRNVESLASSIIMGCPPPPGSHLGGLAHLYSPLCPMLDARSVQPALATEI
ncbi:hypothetical protein CC2G_011648 [Coprinopsis cinerea AmutBmut pab1-1]|nr:hypothetical protein CC2G_011648 [Coprinopsis cinerea AmutBmut pab1-1]